VLAVFGAGDDREAGVHSAALRDVAGDRVAEFGVFVIGVHEVPVCPPALACSRVRAQGAADEQAARGEGFDPQEVAVGQCPAGLAGLGRMVVPGADDQVPGAGPGSVGDACRRTGIDEAEADQVVADAAG
jgi:hypothetical protein